MNELAEVVLNAIRTRRVSRRFTPQPIRDADVRTLLDAARWAPSGGNRRIHILVVVRDPGMVRLIKAFSPGMHGLPTGLVVVCTDFERAARQAVQLELQTTRWIDVGTMAMNMMLAAHALGLGSCPLTSFSRTAISILLELPKTVFPEFVLQVGHPAGVAAPDRRARFSIDDITYWERYGEAGPGRELDADVAAQAPF